MQRVIRFGLATSFAATILAACGKNPPEPPVATLPYIESGVTFTITPTDAPCGAKGQYVADVSWSVPPTSSEKVEVQVGAAERNVFAKSNARTGSERTGQWVVPGLTFYLIDRDAEQVLAAINAGQNGACVASPGAR
jgi:hypothetical protein